jgi:hypothetical protein
MRSMTRYTGVFLATIAAALMAACGGGGNNGGGGGGNTTYTLTVDSASPSTGVSITVAPADNSGAANGSTSFSRTYNSGTSITLTAPSTASGNSFSAWSGCTSANTETCSVTLNSNVTVTAGYTAPVLTTPTVTVTPGSASITTSQALSVTVSLSGTPAPTGSVVLTSGAYTSATTTLAAGGATINIPAGSLATGTDTLTVKYTPDSNSTSLYNSATGTGSVTVTTPALTTPVVTVTPGAASITTSQALSVTVSLSGTPAPTGSVVLTSGTYTSAATTLTAGGATINIPAGSLATGTDSLKVVYTPDANSTSLYNSATGTGSVTVTSASLITPTVTVTPAQLTTAVTQSVNVTISVSGGNGNPTPTGSVVLTAGAYVSQPTNLTAGSTVINVPAGDLPVGTDNLSAVYTPNTASSTIYNGASGMNTINIIASKTTPTVTVTPASFAINSNVALSVTVAVSGANGTPTGSVTLSGGGYTSSATTLSSGSATIDIPANSLSAGSDVLAGSYTPDTASTGIYNSASGNSSAVVVTLVSQVSVNQTNTGPAVSDQILGFNLAAWYDVVGNATAINTAFGAAGIKAIRWPGGSWSDAYHWLGNSSTSNLPYQCSTTNGATTTNGSTQWGGYSTFAQFVPAIVQGGGYDLALTADYGSDAACTGPGDPTEAAAWVTAAAALTNGANLSHVTVGNEEYGSWEIDNHTLQHDPTTYASAVAGTSGYYALMKAANPNVLVGVDVCSSDCAGDGNSTWDTTVLSNAKDYYNFVEYHYYPQNPGNEKDSFLVSQAAQQLTASIKNLKAELVTAGVPNTPIYVGEMGSVSSNPGKQSMSITQALYAGQLLGEMMNDGVARATWWIGFGNCNGTAGYMGTTANPIYGWQDFGAYNVFSDGPSDSTCSPWSTLGTMGPTAVAYQLFSNVAVTGENVLTATVSGDTNDVRAYAATHSGGTALVLFNLSETSNEVATVTLSGGAASSTDVTVITYDKAIYDETNPANAGGPVWAGSSTTDMGAQNLPLTLTLTPWSMNVVLIK